MENVKSWHKYRIGEVSVYIGEQRGEQQKIRQDNGVQIIQGFITRIKRNLSFTLSEMKSHLKV